MTFDYKLLKPSIDLRRRALDVRTDAQEVGTREIKEN
jgi:hypothetical protein